MNAATARFPQPLLSMPARLAGAVAAVAVLAAGVSFAGHASRTAVNLAHAAINPAIVYVTLPTVEVLVRRSGEPIAEVACAKAPSRT